jgi:hypothetical protein
MFIINRSKTNLAKMKSRFIILTLLVFQLHTLFAQVQENTNKDSVKAIVKRFYSANQKKLDRVTSGIGIELSDVRYGANYDLVHFNKIHLRANIFEFKVGIGNSFYHSPFSSDIFNTQVSTWSMGVNQPISVLGIGKANSTSGVRFLPFFTADFGHSSFKQFIRGDEKQASAYHLSIAPGYRIKIPYLIIDFKLNITWNVLTQTQYPGSTFVNNNNDYIKDNSFKTFSFTPCVSFLIDGLFSKFDPKNSVIKGNMVVYDNISEKKYYTGQTYTPETGKTTPTGLYKTETTYQYHSQVMELPISDIGLFLGLGPRLLYFPSATNSFRMPSLMGGAGAHLRYTWFSFDLNVDKGSAGYSSEVNADRTIKTNATDGKGTFDVTNITTNLGIDIGPLLLALDGIIAKRTGQTPYFSISAGFIYGHSYLNNYTYNNKAVGASYQAYFAANPNMSTNLNNPALNKSGEIHGWFIGADVGAVGFKYEYNKYTSAPLARCGYYAISYKYPLFKSKK